MFFKPRANKLITEELHEAERNLLLANIEQQKAVTAITKAEADLIIKNANLAYYQGLVKSLKVMQDEAAQLARIGMPD